MTENQNAKIIALVVSATLITGILLTSLWFFVFNKKTLTGSSVIQQTAPTQATSDNTTKLKLARSTVTSIFLSVEQFKTEWKKYPSTLDEILNVGIIKKEEILAQSGIVYAYEVSDDGKDCAVRTTIDTNQLLTNYCSTYSEMADGVYALTPSERQQVTANAKKIPYVSAQSEVEIIFNAVARYKAFNNAHPKTLQDLVDREELPKEFLSKKHEGYTLSFSAIDENDCKVVVKFSTGESITSLCNDPDYGKQFSN